MDIKEIGALCRSMLGVTIDFPFGPQPECYRVGGKIFATLYPVGVPGALRILLGDSYEREQVAAMAILQCDPAYGDFLRRQYPGIVLRPYHSPPAQQPYANTVLIDPSIPDDIFRDMICHAYSRTLQKLPKKLQRQISGSDSV